MQGRRRWLALVVVAGLLAACSGGSDDEGSSDEATREGGESAEAGTWTVLSYSIADTDLEPFMMNDVDEMSQVGTTEGLNVVALVDRAADYTDQPVAGQEDWVGAKLLQVNPGGGSEVLEDLGDINTGDPAVLTDFIARGIEDYPADNYALVISDHGASWPGIGGDESADHDSLSLAELDEAIGAGIEAAGIEKLDLLGFDACLMATYEVASLLAPHADRMLASQELEPGHGWDYTALQVAADGPVTVDELGSALIDGFESQAKAEGTESEITLSLIDLNAMAALDSALAEFTAAVSERGAELAPVVGRTRANTISYGRSPDPFEDTHMTDLGSLVAEIGVEALDVSDQADGLIRALNDAVLDKVEGQATAGSTGLAIYFPPEADYFNGEYEAIVTDGLWNDFLASYYSAGAEIPEGEQAQFVEGEAEVFFDEDGLNITGIFELAAQDNLAEAFIRYGIVEDDGSVSFLGQEPAAISDDGSGQALGIYDLTTFTMTDAGGDSATGFFDMTTDEESGTITIDVPMAYYSPEDVEGETYQDVLLSLVVDLESGDIISETYYTYDEQTGQYGELTAEPEGIIVPEVLNVLDDGTEEWIATSDVGLFADLPNLMYDLEDLPSGTQVYIELFVIDFGGNSDSVSAVVTVP